MNADSVRTLYDYMYWAHHKMWESVMKLSDEQFARPLDYSVGSIHAQVVHLMGAENIWFSRLQGTSPTAILKPDDYPTRAAIRAGWDEIEAMVRRYLATLTDTHLGEILAYRRTDGTPLSMPIWVVLFQVVNHATDHRALVLYQLHQMGVETFPQDFTGYMLQR